MGKEHDYDIKYQAEELYVEFGFSPEDIGTILNISRHTVLSWRTKFKWIGKKKKYLEEEKLVGQHEKKAELKLAERMGENPSQQNVLVWQMYQKARKLRYEQRMKSLGSRKEKELGKTDSVIFGKCTAIDMPDMPDGLELDEIAIKLLYQKIIAALESNIPMDDVLSIMTKVGRLQYSNIARVRLMSDLDKAADIMAGIVKKGGLKGETVNEIKKTILGVAV
ncbi:MAG: hypothetical protein GY749_02890 [Desulfobacteraceae bacterium]|nr:hypothetical protein [Desulfobacteraceae bacterium]